VRTRLDGRVRTWIIAVALFVLPFLRSRAQADWDAPDPTRRTEYESEEDDAPLDRPFWDDVALVQADADEFEWELEQDLATFIRDESERWWGTGGDAPGRALFDPAKLMTGERSYVRQCAGCHSLSGDGAGPAARHLVPRPRNFRKGLFKFKSTGTGERPRPEDMMQVITRGLSGSAMPPFNLLPEQKRWAIVEWVRYLSMRGEFEQLLVDLTYSDEELPDAEEIFELVRDRWDLDSLRPQFPTVTEPEYNAESIARGQALFNDAAGAACYTCHGAGGRGDGPTADAYRDGWGYPIRPRDLTTGQFRAGETGKDLWLTIGNGIGGTPMPAYSGALTGEQIWELVHFVQSLSDESKGGAQ